MTGCRQVGARPWRLVLVGALAVTGLLPGSVSAVAQEGAPETIGVVRDGEFFLRDEPSSRGVDHEVSFGRGDDEPLLGDWNGDGHQTVGVRRGNRFLLRNANAGGPADRDFRFGRASDEVGVGDWNGDGVDTVGVRRGSRFLLRNVHRGGPADEDVRFGRPGDVPVTGDWNGDGVDTVGVRRGSRFLLRNSFRGGAADEDVYFGGADDVPLAGDWNGDGLDTVGVRRGSRFLLRNALRGGGADLDFHLGRSSDRPLAGTWTGAVLPTLARGDRGAAVRSLQAELAELGYFATVDGIFGELTVHQVWAFQKVNGLAPTGVVDREVWAALREPRAPRARSSSGRWIEVDLERQVLHVVTHGRVELTFHVSTGHGEWYEFDGERYRATTTTGRQRIVRQVDGYREAERGRLYRPKYFDGSRGIAFHGYPDVPNEPVSSGCVRMSNAAIDAIWDRGLAPLGTDVWVYPAGYY